MSEVEMQRKECEELLVTSDEQLNLAISFLQNRGILLDEDRTFIGSIAIERCANCIQQKLQLHGYDGGELKTFGKFFNSHGAVYGVYDSERLTLQEAYAYADTLVANNAD